MNDSKVNKVFNALILNRQELSAKQIASRYKLSNPYDAIYALRREGYAINLVDTGSVLKYSHRNNLPSVTSYTVGSR